MENNELDKQLGLDTETPEPKAAETDPTEDQLLIAELEAVGIHTGEAQEGPLNVGGISEVPPEEKIDSEASDTLQETSLENDALPLDERLKEFEIPAPSDKPSLRDELKGLETQIKQEAVSLQKDFLADLPQLHKAGKSIYAMDQSGINDYIVELQDAGKAFEAGQVQTNYLKALDAATAYQGRLKDFETKQTQYQQAADYVDWTEIKAEVASKLPELKQEDFDKVGQYIDQKAGADPVYYSALSTKEGKLQKGVEALNALGIIDRLKEARKKDAMPDDEAPTAPDANLSSKRVKVKPGKSGNSYDAVAKTSLAEFKKLPQEAIDAALELELQPLLDKLGR